MSRYRLVHFVPSMAVGARFPIAALVEAGGRLDVVRAAKLPDARCLGGLQRLEVCKLALEMLGQTEAFDQLPRSLNNLAVLGEPTGVPADDAVEWVQTYVFPRALDHAGTRGRKRATEGYDALVRTVVQGAGVPRSWIRKTFEPTHDGPRWFRPLSALPRVTHWVGRDDAEDVLLLEPVILHRPSLFEDLERVGMILGAYRVASEKLGRSKDVSIGAYVVGSDTLKARRDVVRQLDVFADDVYDLDVPGHQLRLSASMQRAMHEHLPEAK